MSWQELADQYQERGLVIVLGAGVSFGSGIPTWEGLLCRIAGAIVQSKTRGISIIRELKEYGFSFPAIASVLEGMCTTHKFRDLVRSELYKDFPFKGGIHEQNRSSFIKYIKENNPTLAAIASLCVIPSRENCFERNPRVHAVINFNLDSIFRAYVYERYERYLLRSIERASKNPDLKKTSVYYMHGFLRFDLEQDDPSEEAADKMVFTEREYFNFFNSPTSLFNYTFLYLLREYPCLFVGISMIDDNIRRLMHYSRGEREQAYAEEGRPQHAPKSVRHFAIIRRRSKDFDALVDNSVQVLGAKVLWVDEYSEIPHNFRHIYTTGGGDWNSVW